VAGDSAPAVPTAGATMDVEDAVDTDWIQGVLADKGIAGTSAEIAALLDGGLMDDAARRAAQGAGGVGALAGGAGGAEVVGVLGGVLGGTGAAFGALGGAGALGLASARAARPDSGLDHNVGCDSAPVCVAITPYCNGHARREGGGLSQQRKRI
jgi:hypothetical protein